MLPTIGAFARMNNHPDPSQILALVRTVTPELRDGVLEHVATCRTCGQLLERSVGEVRAAEQGRKVLNFERLPLPRALPPAAPPRVWWSRPRSSVSELVAAEAPLADLLVQPERQRPLVVRNCARFHDPALVELVLEAGRDDCYEDPSRGARLVELGLSIIDLLDGEYYGRRLLDELRGRGWIYRANAHRIVGELAEAESAFRRAGELLAGGAGPLERASLLQMMASLRRVQDRVPEALELLTEAAAILESEGEDTKAGRVYSGIGLALLEIGELEHAEQALSEALVRIDAGEEPRALISARHNLVICLTEQERYQEAADLLAELGPEFDRFDDFYNRTRRSWIEGRVLSGLRRDDDAERIFTELIREFREAGRALSAADVSLHLALIYERQGRAAELRRLAEEMTSIFFSREIPRETAVALTFFVRAVEQERVNRLVIERVAGYRKRAQSEPDLRFSDYP